MDVEFFNEQIEDVRVDRLFDLETHRRTEAATCQLAFKRLQQVLGLVLFDLDVLVARDAEGVVLQDFHAREETVEMRGDDVFERNKAFVLERNEARQCRRHFDAGKMLGARRRIANDDGEVEREAGDVRKRDVQDRRRAASVPRRCGR